MPSIYIMSIIFTVFALGLFGALLYFLKPRTPIGWLLLLMILELPLEPLSILYFRRPMGNWLHDALGETGFFFFLQVWYAPVTEELAKLLPVIVFYLWGKIEKDRLHEWMLPIGFGFGIGEAWMIASLLTTNPEVTSMPWYNLGGFFGERLQVCFIHGAMTGAGLMLSIGQGRWLPGTLLSFCLHFCVNVPLYILGPHVFNANKTVMMLFALAWTTAAFLAGLAFILGRDGAAGLGLKLFGQAQCPRCKAIYNRSLWGMNLGPVRYERCPDCKTWNKTSEYKPPVKAE